MFLTCDFFALTILCFSYFPRFFLGDRAVGAGLVFHFLDTCLTFVEASGLFLGELAGIYAGIYTPLLIILALVNSRCRPVAGRLAACTKEIPDRDAMASTMIVVLMCILGSSPRQKLVEFPYGPVAVYKSSLTQL